MRLLCTVLLVILIPLTLHAAVTASYDPEPVLFFEPSAEHPHLPSDKLVAKLGTVTFTGNPIHHPTFVPTTMTCEFVFSGPISSGNGGHTPGNPLFFLYAVTTSHQGTTVKQLNDDTKYHALQSHNGNISPVVVHLYLVSELALSRFKEGGAYTLFEGNLEGFQIGVANSGSGYQPGSDPLVPINGLPADTPTPILPEESNPEAPIIYGDPINTVNCTFTIINEQPFELDQVYSTGSAEVATAQISLSNVASDQTYGVTLTFTNAADTPPFLMTLQETMTDPPTIEYRLLFDNNLLNVGGSVDWKNLTDETFTEDIYVTGISSSIGQSYLSGSYSDTVYVNITPIE